jgi:hypothetical protein
MARETDHNLPITDEPVADDTKSDSPVMSTSSNAATIKIADKTVPSMSDYWKKSTINKANRKAYHSAGWLTSNLESSVSKVDVPTVDGTTMICFESHLIVGLGLPPSMFFIAIMNFLGWELVHLNPNTIAALSFFTMLCESWLGIVLDTSLFWYFYFVARYDKVVFSEIGLSLSHRCWKEYIRASFKGSWKGATQRWFLVDMHVEPQWANKHLLPPLIKNKWGEPKMALRLAALVKWLAELRNAGHRAFHYIEEFTLRRISPLDHREKLTYLCPHLADPSRKPVASKIFNFTYYC